MKLLVFYRPNAEESRLTEDYLRDLTRMHDVKEQDIRVIDPDSREGGYSASLYDVMSYPSIVITDSYGQFVKSWNGELPLMDELVSYTFSN